MATPLNAERAEQISFDMMVAWFFESPNFQALAPSTQDFYKSVLGIVLEIYSQQERQYDNYSDLLKAVSAALEARGVCGASIQQYITVAKIVLRWAGKPTEFTYRIPSAERKASQLKRINRWFNQQDIDACLNHRFGCNHERNHLMIRMLIETGARVRELASVTISSIDLDANTIFLSDSKTEPRPAFFSDETGVLLGLYIERLAPSRRVQLQIVPDEEKVCDQLFVSVQQIQKIVNDMLVDIGLKNGKDGRGPHTFRHWCATYLHYVGGMSLTDIGFLLGDKPDMIRDRYLHPTAEMLQGRMKAAMRW
jgi:integrase